MRRYVALLDNQPPEILFLTSSDASDSLADAGFAAFKIPSKTVARKTELNKLEYRRLAKHFVWNTLGIFKPDLLVVDTFPAGSFDELFQVLDGPFRSSFVYRNVCGQYAERPTFRSALQMYDQLVAPHGKHESQGGGFASHADNLKFSGEVIQFEHEDLLPRDVARKQLGIPDEKKLVYLSAGGGGDPNAQAQLHSLAECLSGQPEIHMLVGAGPLYRGQRFAGPNITWFDGPSIAQYFGALNAAVSAAGYNTFHELIFARVPTAFYAQEKVADDQADRIRWGVDAGACRLIPDIGDRSSVVEVVLNLLRENETIQFRTACKNLLPVNHANRCAMDLLAPLYDEPRLHWAKSVLTPKLARRLEKLSHSSSGPAQWLVPLMPADQMRTIQDHPGLDAVIDQLSPSAAEEMRAALADGADSSEHMIIESKLVEFADTLDPWSEPDRFQIADAALRTVLAMMKKQPLSGELDQKRSTWIASILEIITSVVRCHDNEASDIATTLDRLSQLRAFPRIVDADLSVAIDCYDRFVAQHRASRKPERKVDHAIQLLKLTYPRVTQSIVNDAIERIASQPTSAMDSMPEPSKW